MTVASSVVQVERKSERDINFRDPPTRAGWSRVWLGWKEVRQEAEGEIEEEEEEFSE